jgi:ABC-type amino acid transport substrate-binding protein
VDGSVDILVGDTPINKANLSQIENYGFAMPIGSPLRMALNRQLLKMQESRETHSILAGYFGEANVQ